MKNLNIQENIINRNKFVELLKLLELKLKQQNIIICKKG